MSALAWGLALGGMGVTVFRCTGDANSSLLAVICVIVSLWQVFLPVSYELRVQGVCCSALGRIRVIPWSAVAKFEICRSGILLWPNADPCSMDACRATYLPWGDHREEVLALLPRLLERAGQAAR